MSEEQDRINAEHAYRIGKLEGMLHNVVDQE